jgi:hypothetical protein
MRIPCELVSTSPISREQAKQQHGQELSRRPLAVGRGVTGKICCRPGLAPSSKSIAEPQTRSPDLLPMLAHEAGKRDGFIERIAFSYPDTHEVDRGSRPERDDQES